MKKEEIKLSDIKRILLGNAPPEFLLEVFIRTLFIYVIALVIYRWLGKRMSGQITILEMSITIMLGAIVANPMQLPDRGIALGVMVLLLVLGLLRGSNLWSFIKPGFEKLVQGDLSILVKDSVLQLPAMKRANVSRQQLFAELRGKEIFNLGAVERVYLEACGQFSIYTKEKHGPGLALYPPDDQDILATCNKDEQRKVCANCGLLQPAGTSLITCTNCGSDQLITPIL